MLKTAARSEEGEDIRERSRRQESRLGGRTTLNKAFRKTVELEVAKQIAGASIRLRKISVRVLRRGRHPPKRKKRLHTE
jgi:hypothetical protein